MKFQRPRQYRNLPAFPTSCTAVPNALARISNLTSPGESALTSPRTETSPKPSIDFLTRPQSPVTGFSSTSLIVRSIPPWNDTYSRSLQWNGQFEIVNSRRLGHQFSLHYYLTYLNIKSSNFTTRSPLNTRFETSKTSTLFLTNSDSNLKQRINSRQNTSELTSRQEFALCRQHTQVLINSVPESQVLELRPKQPQPNSVQSPKLSSPCFLH